MLSISKFRVPLLLSLLSHGQAAALADHPRRVNTGGERWFSRGAEAIGVGLVPYQARHSGASIDAANNVRGLPSIQKRGRWASKKPVQRYEKAGRLQDTWRELTSWQKDHFKLCAESLRSVMLENRGYPPVMAGPPREPFGGPKRPGGPPSQACRA